ncbi:hypothetical protein AQPE_4844 [Aquipluma nitroreducens]|uniref:Uncharacterized protein n=1 Tax=Aquipluma nitroreducens TaxID=2010828 RepID=A0A5K7SGB7_9BACT|nr:hypothetical protein AQPE_4844 [Aquipluma nitroreducens]
MSWFVAIGNKWVAFLISKSNWALLPEIESFWLEYPKETELNKNINVKVTK